MAHVSSRYPRPDAGIGHCGTPCDGGAFCGLPEGSEDLSRCSPLNLAGPRPRDATPPPPPLHALAPHAFTELAAGAYSSYPIVAGLDPLQLQPNYHHHEQGPQHRQLGLQHQKQQQQQPAVRAERPPPGVDWQLPPCATIRLARSPAPMHPALHPMPLALVASPPPQQPVPHHHLAPLSPHHHHQQQHHHHHQDQDQTLPPPEASLASPFCCSTCGRGFDGKQALRVHSEEHSVGKLCICDVCGIRLSKKSSLRRHRLTHHETKEIPCDVCHRYFYQRHDMLRHKAHHSKVALQCAGCARQFSARHHLAAHKCSGAARPGGRRRPAGDGQRTDTSQLTCPLCSQTCSTPAAWGFHMWRHTKDAKYLPDFTGGMAAFTASPDPQTGAATKTVTDTRSGPGPEPKAEPGPETELVHEKGTEREPGQEQCLGARTGPQPVP